MDTIKKELPDDTGSGDAVAKDDGDSGIPKCEQCGRTFGRKCALTAHCVAGCNGMVNGDVPSEIDNISYHSSSDTDSYHSDTPDSPSTLKKSTGKGDSEDFKCSKCSKCFQSKRALTQHIAHQTCQKESQKENKQFYCGTCKHNFRTVSSLRKHLKRIHNISDIPDIEVEVKQEVTTTCSVSNKNNKNGKLTCETCGREFSRYSSLTLHQAAGCNKLMVGNTCSICELSLSSNSCLRKHMRRVHKEMVAAIGLTTVNHADVDPSIDYKCQTCKRSFLTKAGYSRHKKVCSTSLNLEKRYCQICDLTFSDTSCLRKHIKRKHKTTETPKGNDSVEKSFMEVKLEIRANHDSGLKKNKIIDTETADLSVSFDSLSDDVKNESNAIDNVIESLEGLTSERKSKDANIDDDGGLNIDERGDNSGEETGSHEGKENKTNRIKKKGKILTCDVCKRTFGTIHALTSHRKTHTDTKKCKFCGEILKCGIEWKNERRNHMRIHEKEKAAETGIFADLEDENDCEIPVKEQLKCGVCEKQFRQLNALVMHMKGHNELIQCEICGETLQGGQDFKNERRKHMREHYRLMQKFMNIPGENESPNGVKEEIPEPLSAYQCDVCFIQCSSAESLQEHQIFHQEPRQCKSCDETFDGGRDWMMHQFAHRRYEGRLLEKIFCHICGNSFETKSGYNKHLRKHEGKFYSCDICSKKFTASHSLKEHMRIHRGERPFICEICGSTFIARSKWARHFRTHTGERNYKCDTCGSCFIDSTRLNVHKRIHTGARPYACTLCNRKFVQQSTLRNHKKTHFWRRDFQCQLCERLFTSKHALLKHGEMHTKVHPNTKPAYITKPTLFCDKCPKGFITARGLTRHNQKHLKGILPVLRSPYNPDSDGTEVVSEQCTNETSPTVAIAPPVHAKNHLALPPLTKNQATVGQSPAKRQKKNHPNSAQKVLNNNIHVEERQETPTTISVERERIAIPVMGNGMTFEDNRYPSFHQLRPCNVASGPYSNLLLGPGVPETFQISRVNLPYSYSFANTPAQVFQSHTSDLIDQFDVLNNAVGSVEEKMTTGAGSVQFSHPINTGTDCRYVQLKSAAQIGNKTTEPAFTDNIQMVTVSQSPEVHVAAVDDIEVRQESDFKVRQESDFKVRQESEFIKVRQEPDLKVRQESEFIKVRQEPDFKVRQESEFIEVRQEADFNDDDNDDDTSPITDTFNLSSEAFKLHSPMIENCSQCSERFDNRKALEQHVQESHQREKQFQETEPEGDCEVQCMRCQEKFFSLFKLMSHVKQCR